MSAGGHGQKQPSSSDFKSLFNLPPARHAQVDLIKLAQLMDTAPEGAKDGPDDEENPFIPAGYTYLGQFVDHDLTFDTSSNLADLNSFHSDSDMRTPRFDLDNVYGAGPDDQPYLYDQQPFTGKLLLGKTLDNGVADVLRNPQGRAIIGDPRDDENAIVVQLQSAFIRFHNSLVQRAIDGRDVPKRTGRDVFDWAQSETRFHYQRLLLDDYLPRIIHTGSSTVRQLFEALKTGKTPVLKVFPLDQGPFMPLEFAMAAYRFGHSMIRPGYRLAEGPDADVLLSIFDGPAGGLRGFKELDAKRGIDWRLFFHPTLRAGDALDETEQTDNNNKNTDADQKQHMRVQFAYKIDTMLVDPITKLPEVVAPGLLPDVSKPMVLRSLAVRNLLRGSDFNLPSGEAVARAMKLADSQILGKDQIAVRRQPTPGTDDPDNFLPNRVVKISDQLPVFEGNTPLWFYVLAEAQQAVMDGMKVDQAKPHLLGSQLGPVGGAIVAETFVGLMMIDPDSVLNTPSTWHSLLNGTPNFTMVEFLREAGSNI